MTSGQLGFDNGAAQMTDAATVRTERQYLKWNAALYQLQNIGATNSLYLVVSGQWTNSNLESSQKVLAGGPYTVRAYDMGAIAGDTGYQETVEFRHRLAATWQGQWQTPVFLDSAQVTINKNPTVPGKNTATLSGAGVGLNWIGPYSWSATTYIAIPFGSPPPWLRTPRRCACGSSSAKGFEEPPDRHAIEPGLMAPTPIRGHDPSIRQFFAGKCDGKIGAPQHEVSCFQVLRDA